MNASFWKSPKNWYPVRKASLSIAKLVLAKYKKKLTENKFKLQQKISPVAKCLLLPWKQLIFISGNFVKRCCDRKQNTARNILDTFSKP